MAFTDSLDKVDRIDCSLPEQVCGKTAQKINEIVAILLRLAEKVNKMRGEEKKKKHNQNK